MNIRISPGLWLGLWCGAAFVQAQPSSVTPEYSRAAEVFPRIYKPYKSLPVPEPDLANAATVPLTVEDGKLRLSMAQLVAAVVKNNLTIASARYYPSEAQTDL